VHDRGVAADLLKKKVIFDSFASFCLHLHLPLTHKRSFSSFKVVGYDGLQKKFLHLVEYLMLPLTLS
jgi:hypothetical protein